MLELNTPNDDELQQAINNVCDGDAPHRAVNVEIGFLDLFYRTKLALSPTPYEV